MLCEGERNKWYVTRHWFHWDLVTRQVSVLMHSARLSEPLTSKLCALGEIQQEAGEVMGLSYCQPYNTDVLAGL